MKKLCLILCIILSQISTAQPNCELYEDNKACYEACKKAIKAIHYPQGSYQSQAYFQESLDLCPTFDYSWMEKAVPYLKRGLFIEWKKMIDKAVEINPVEYLAYRGWCRLQFLRDYKGYIKDIEKLKELVNYDIGYCQTGDYHLEIARALCYKELGNKMKAKEIFTNKLADSNYYVGIYDYYHFGVLEFELGDYKQAKKHFLKQIEINDDLAETYYFLGLIAKRNNKIQASKKHLLKAQEYYLQKKYRTETYAETLDKIYLLDINKALNEL
jgi:tetratricopeptide (TPR) repeat protein